MCLSHSPYRPLRRVYANNPVTDPATNCILTSMDTQVLGQVLVLFILIAVGFISFKLKITTKEAAAYFSSFVMKLTLPCLILYSFRRPFSRDLLGEAAITLGIAFAVYGFLLLFALAYPHAVRMKGPERGIHRYALFISNSGFFGYPVIQAILGSAYLFHASLFNVPSNILAFSVGAWLVAKEGGKAPAFSWKIFITPATVCTVIGFVMFVFSVPLPGPVDQGISLAGNMTTPLSMVVLGISIAQTNIKQILGRWQVYVTVFARLLLLPALTGLACYLAGLRGPLLMLSVIIAGMPAGSSTSILASLYNVAEEEAGSIVALSMLLCAVTIPLMVVVVHLIGG